MKKRPNKTAQRHAPRKVDKHELQVIRGGDETISDPPGSQGQPGLVDADGISVQEINRSLK